MDGYFFRRGLLGITVDWRLQVGGKTENPFCGNLDDLVAQE